MFCYHISLAIIISTIFSNSIYAEKTKDQSKLLTCEKLEYILIHYPANEIRPYCNKAEIQCRSIKMVQKRKKNDPLRKKVEGKLKVEMRYDLDICEIALREIDPNFLTKR